MKREFYESPKPSSLMKLFWNAAGADRYILERSTYSDQVKYACLGGIVVATGFMAAVAGGYAMYTIFEPKGDAMEVGTHIPTAIRAGIFGIIWGLIIFNIDRFIVAATGKGDGTEAITKAEMKGALPRILMGLVIALTISKPVEIRMFKSEIDAELYQSQLEKRKVFESKTKSNYQDRLDLVQSDLLKIEASRTDLVERVKKAEQEHTDQLQGRSGSGAGDGRLSRALEKIKNDLITELNQFDHQNKDKRDRLENQKLKLLNELEEELQKNKQVAGGLDGLLERIKLCHKIAGFWISTFVTLLFVVIELTPIFFKMMLIKSPYDYMGDNIKDLIKAENGIEIKYDYYQDKTGQERNLVIHHKAKKLLEEKKNMLEAQMEVSKEIVEKWKISEKKKADDNIDDYIS